MTPNCLLLDNQLETIFCPKILSYKNGMEKLIFREDEKKNQEETQDCQRSIPSILDPWHSKQPLNLTKNQSPGL